MATIASYLELLTRETRKSEAEVMALAIEAGLRQLWRDHLLGQYLRGRMTREDVVKAVGADWVDLAEREFRAMREDLEWAKDLAPSP